MKKKLLIGLGVLVGLLVVVLVGVALAIDPIVKGSVEKLGSEALKVPVTLESATVKFAGRLTLDNMAIANPEGYKDPQACAFEQFDAAISVGSLFDEVVVIDHVTILKPDMTIEFVGTKSNWSVLMDNLSEGRKKEKEAEEKEDEAPPKKFRIGKILVKDATVRFRSDLLIKDGTSVTIPLLELDNVGTAENAATFTEIMAMLFQSLATGALRAKSGLLPAQLAGLFNGEVTGAAGLFDGLFKSGTASVKEVSGKLLENAGETIKDAGRSIKDAAKDAGKSIKGLFGGKKEE